MNEYEVDFLQVGTGEKSGDSIALRFWDSNNPTSSQKVFVIDGGTKTKIALSGDSFLHY